MNTAQHTIRTTEGSVEASLVEDILQEEEEEQQQQLEFNNNINNNHNNNNSNATEPLNKNSTTTIISPLTPLTPITPANVSHHNQHHMTSINDDSNNNNNNNNNDTNDREGHGHLSEDHGNDSNNSNSNIIGCIDEVGNGTNHINNSSCNGSNSSSSSSNNSSNNNTNNILLSHGGNSSNDLTSYSMPKSFSSISLSSFLPDFNSRSRSEMDLGEDESLIKSASTNSLADYVNSSALLKSPSTCSLSALHKSSSTSSLSELHAASLLKSSSSASFSKFQEEMERDDYEPFSPGGGDLHVSSEMPSAVSASSSNGFEHHSHHLSSQQPLPPHAHLAPPQPHHHHHHHHQHHPTSHHHQHQHHHVSTMVRTMPYGKPYTNATVQEYLDEQNMVGPHGPGVVPSPDTYMPPYPPTDTFSPLSHSTAATHHHHHHQHHHHQQVAVPSHLSYGHVPSGAAMSSNGPLLPPPLPVNATLGRMLMHPDAYQNSSNHQHHSLSTHTSSTEPSSPTISTFEQFNKKQSEEQPIANPSLDPDVKVKPGECVEIGGEKYNDRGYKICGHMNQHSKPCQRIGRCPFHWKLKKEENESNSDSTNSESQPKSQNGGDSGEAPHHPTTLSSQAPLDQKAHNFSKISTAPAAVTVNNSNTSKIPLKKGPYKQGWSKEEHLLFLKGLKQYGKGAWKEIATIVGTRTPTQIQSHAQKYFLRQKQKNKNKRSIHDITMESLNGGQQEANDDENDSDASDGSSKQKKKKKDPETLSESPATESVSNLTSPSATSVTPSLSPTPQANPQQTMSPLNPHMVQNIFQQPEFHKMSAMFPNIHPSVLAQLIALNSLNTNTQQSNFTTQQAMNINITRPTASMTAAATNTTTTADSPPHADKKTDEQERQEQQHLKQEIPNDSSIYSPSASVDSSSPGDDIFAPPQQKT